MCTSTSPQVLLSSNHFAVGMCCRKSVCTLGVIDIDTHTHTHTETPLGNVDKDPCACLGLNTQCISARNRQCYLPTYFINNHYRKGKDIGHERTTLRAERKTEDAMLRRPSYNVKQLMRSLHFRCACIRSCKESRVGQRLI